MPGHVYYPDLSKRDRYRNLLIAPGDGPGIDAFARGRVSNPDTIFDASFRYNAQPLIFNTSTANGGLVTHSANNAAVDLTLDGTPSGSSIFQSKRYMTYIPGKSQLVYMTGVIGTAVAGVKKRIGYFDANNGIFFEQNGVTDYAWTVRTNTSGAASDANRVAQSSWNLDKLDGTGPSGITANFTYGQILVIDFQWLGLGRIRVGFDIGGLVVYCHEFLWANTAAATTVYMKNASLPVRYEITGGTVATLRAICCSVQSEGGADKFFGYTFDYDRGVVNAANGSQTYAFSLRPKATFNSITNRMNLQIDSFELAVTGNSPVLLEVYYNTTVGGAPTWTDVDATYSAMQYDTTGTPSGGVKVYSFTVPSSAQAKGGVSRDFVGRYPLFLDIAGTGYTNLTVYVTGLGGASNCYPCGHWTEIR